MKLSLSTFLITVALPTSQSYLANSPRFAYRGALTCLSSSTSSDADFSAFADSLEEEPESVPDQPWQAKLEELIDPKTNLAERQILLSELLSSNDEIRDSVLDALASRNVS